jgi:hypothetical protein
MEPCRCSCSGCFQWQFLIDLRIMSSSCLSLDSLRSIIVLGGWIFLCIFYFLRHNTFYVVIFVELVLCFLYFFVWLIVISFWHFLVDITIFNWNLIILWSEIPIYVDDMLFIHSFDCVKNWFTELGLSVNPDKTELRMENQVTYLRVILDKKLDW